MAFQQLQTALASKDLELARNQHNLSILTAEVMELRRTHKRDGINMDYLKNVVLQVSQFLLVFVSWFIDALQFMTLPIDSSEKTSLVRVIATLLQFTPKELMTVQQFDPKPQWSLFGSSGGSSKPVKDIKRTTVRVAGASIMPKGGAAAGSAASGGAGGAAGSALGASSGSCGSSSGGAVNGHSAAGAGLRKDSADEREFRAKLEQINVADILNMSASTDEAGAAAHQQGPALNLSTPRVQFSV